MAISTICKGLNFTHFDTVGKCFTDVVFFGDATFATLIVIAMFAFIGVKAGLPLEVMYPFGLGIMFSMWLLSGSMWLLGFFLLGLVLGGFMLGFKVLENLNRG